MLICRYCWPTNGGSALEAGHDSVNQGQAAGSRANTRVHDIMAVPEAQLCVLIRKGIRPASADITEAAITSPHRRNRRTIHFKAEGKAHLYAVNAAFFPHTLRACPRERVC